MVRSKHINNCPVTVQYVGVLQEVWGKNISSFKGKTTQIKPNLMARDQANIPKGLIKLHKEVFLTYDIFFVNKTPFFLTLSRKLYFLEVNKLANHTVPEIFNDFKELYQYYLHLFFLITTVHVGGELRPLKSLV